MGQHSDGREIDIFRTESRSPRVEKGYQSALSCPFSCALFTSTFRTAVNPEAESIRSDKSDHPVLGSRLDHSQATEIIMKLNRKRMPGLVCSPRVECLRLQFQ
jgi:hypothetical protein